MLDDDNTRPMAHIEAHLDAFVSGLEVPNVLREGIAYALLGGGKRLRPLLAWHTAVAAGGDVGMGETSLPAGAAVELVHAFSLVHDDLPAMDDDDMRRGRPTLHVHAGEAAAILAGDAMLALAFEALARDEHGAEAPAALQATLTQELARATTAMIVGQVYDTLGGFAPGTDAESRLRLVHTNKTGALIGAACRMGARCGLTRAGREGDVSRQRSIARFADAIGLMYQVVDDLIDVEQSAEHTGKRTGKDADAGKLTFPGVLGVKASRERIEELFRDAIDALRPLGPEADALRDMGDYLAHRTR